jgi:hypothetical protein
MTPDEELQELRAYKQKYEDLKRVQEAHKHERYFLQLEDLLQRAHFDPIMSPQAFKLLANCILALKEQIK